MRSLGFALIALLTLNVQTPRPATDTTTNGAATHARASIVGATAATRAPTMRFQIDAARSDFMVRAFAGGTLWFKGHDHFVRPRDFSGEATLTPGAINPASLSMRVSAA